MVMKRPVGRSARHADEQDLVGGWRRVYLYLKKPGVAAALKRRIRRRERHEVKVRLRVNPEEL
jgi:hypothetical protein